MRAELEQQYMNEGFGDKILSCDLHKNVSFENEPN